MINLREIREIIYQIFSESGYSINNINVQFPQPLDISVTQDGEEVSLDFQNKSPKITWTRFISLSAYINGIALGKDGGTIKIKYLPDIDFDYDNPKELSLFGQAFDFSDIEEEISNQYSDEARQKLAQRCLQYGIEWATIASQSSCFAQANKSEQEVFKSQCKNFIKDNVANEERYGSAILTFILLYVLLPVVLKFIVERLFKKLFN